MAIIARDLEGSGVTANVLVPGGVVDTHLVPPEINRTGWIQPQIMHAPVVWLASEASGSVWAKAIEEAGFDSICIGESIGRSQTTPRPDILLWLTAAAVQTQRLEWITAILEVPLPVTS
jgi:hypothetical protein